MNPFVILQEESQLQLPEWYEDDSSLKNRLFYRMHQLMKDSLRYLYTKSETTYADLLKAGYVAEIESAKGRALHSKVAVVKQEEMTNTNQGKSGTTLKHFNQMVTKIEELTTLVKSAQFNGNKKGGQKGSQKNSQSAPTTPAKSKAANQGNNEGDKFVLKPPHCWYCGGWGHIIHECPSTSNVKWWELSESVGTKTQQSKAQGGYQ